MMGVDMKLGFLACVLTPLVLCSETVPVDLRLTGPWTVRVSVAGARPVSGEITIARLGSVMVASEYYDRLPDFDARTKAGWRKGVRLSGVRAEECTVQGALDPASLVVRDGPDAGSKVFRRGIDYEADVDAGTVGRLPGGGIRSGQPVYLSYLFGKQRIDSIVLDGTGKLVVREGLADAVTPAVPRVGQGERRVANVLVLGRDSELRTDSLFPILEDAYPEAVVPGASIAEARLRRALAKLRSGERLRIMAWGDSVSTYQRYQVTFVERLKTRFPRANIELITEAWGGRSTLSYLNEPAGSEHNYAEKVLGRRPDLIISEFVNDAGMNEAQVEERYSRLLGDFGKIGAEWIILSPHYVRPDWMGLRSQREIDEDPRPYVKGIRAFAERHGVALADASARYGRLWRQGIPYLTLMENNINHPNLFGHSLFADSLIALFPPR